jgi:geranylgeranyl diphosphate synthase type II
MDLKKYLKSTTQKVDAALNQSLPRLTKAPSSIHSAMRYSIFAGGKRLRPVLCIAAAEACGGKASAAMPAACAVELIHTYSLVHDDLPCMDDDDLRRGRPTCHKVYGDGMAVLTGDALLTEAFAVLATAEPAGPYGIREYITELADASGSRRLIGGQVLDLEGEGQKLTKAQLVKIHEAKTAALLMASLRLGAMSAGASSEQLTAISDFGYALGLAFQVIDDILDVTQSTEILGKTAGKDQAVEKSTYPAVIGLDASRREAARLTNAAHKALLPLGTDAKRLAEIADHLLQREY